jgi:ABC-2 type transport system permease protein
MSVALHNVRCVFKRELQGYFATPVAYVFLVIYLILAGVFTWYLGGLYEQDQADLTPFFSFQPWLFLALIPALAMRLWAEERHSGTIELLLTLPISPGQAVLGKFLAAWLFVGVALALTVGEWITVAWLGGPDHGVIATSYLGTLLLAGGFLAIGACLSALTRNQVVAFVLSISIGFLFILSGYPAVLEFAEAVLPEFLVEAVQQMSFLTHFNGLVRGVIDARDVVFFLSLIGVFLFANTIIVDSKKAD